MREEQGLLGLMGLGQSLGLGQGTEQLRLWICIVFGSGGEGEGDAIAKHILIVHALSGALSHLQAAKAEDRRALGHAQHLATAVV